MAKDYRDYSLDQAYLLPQAPREWLPEGHLALFLEDAVGLLDLSEITQRYRKGRGPRAYHPRMLLTLLLYGYCRGVYSSRKIAGGCETDVAFRVLSGGQFPDFRTVADFRKDHLAAFEGLFIEVLGLCREVGLVRMGHLSLDGSKYQANASKHKAMSYGRIEEPGPRLEAEVKELLRRAAETDEAKGYQENGSAAVETYSASDPEETDITWTLSGEDSEDFLISADGALTFNAPPDFESPSDADTDNVYALRVTAKDATDNEASIDVTITVNNVEEAGTVSFTSSQPQVGTILTASLSDPDGAVSEVSWQWASSPDQSDWTDINGADTASYTPQSGDLGQYLRSTASYTDGEGSGKSAQAVSGQAVQAAPVTNAAPEFPSESAVRSVEENSSAGTDVGLPVAATDEDIDELTYLLTSSGADHDSFTIDSGGQIQVAEGADLDFESGTTSYSVVVTAADPSGATDTIMVTITVTDMDEAGAVALSSTQPQEGAELTASLTDPDGSVSNESWQWASSSDWDASTQTGTWSDISGATFAAYTPTADDVGNYLRATVMAMARAPRGHGEPGADEARRAHWAGGCTDCER